MPTENSRRRKLWHVVCGPNILLSVMCITLILPHVQFFFRAYKKLVFVVCPQRRRNIGGKLKEEKVTCRTRWEKGIHQKRDVKQNNSLFFICRPSEIHVTELERMQARICRRDKRRNLDPAQLHMGFTGQSPLAVSVGS